MKTINRILAAFLSVIMIISIVSVPVCAQSGADYTELNTFIAQAESIDRNMYTDDSLSLLDSIVGKFDFTLSSSEQPVVDGWADELEAALAGLEYDLSKANADVLIDLSDKKLSADDILTVTIKLTTNFYVTNIQLPVIFDKTQFEVVGKVSNSSFYKVDDVFGTRNYRFGGRADRDQGFGYTSNDEKWDTEEAKAKYGYAYITASYDSSIGNDNETYAKPQNEVFVTFELKALVSVDNALESVFISSDWAKTKDNKQGILVVGMTTSETYDPDAALIPYANISYATDTVKHYYDAEIVAPTCTERGYTKYSCTECEYSYVGDYVEATGHTKLPAVEENVTEADCENDGSYDTVVYCKVCAAELSRETTVIPAYGHYENRAVKENKVEPDCINSGSYDNVVYCLVCSEELSRETIEVPAKGHVEGEAVIENNVAPDCENIGSYDSVVYCTVCNAELSRVTITVDALGHKYETEITAPTCTEKGFTTYTCSVCGDSYVSDYTDETGHTEGEAVIENDVAPDCENTGSYENVVYCTVCNVELSRVTITVDALGHKYETEITAPTCTEKGFTTYTCSVCGDSYVSDYTDETGHTEGEAVIENNTAPDCENTGSYENVVYCTVCSTEISRETIIVDALGHKYETEITAPTCTEKGFTTYTCSVCGDSYVSDYTDETGHTEGEAVIENNTAPDCEKTGSYDSVVYCTVCNTEISRETITVDALGHKYETEITAPTCTEKGYTTFTCEVCGDTYVSEETSPLGHTQGIAVKENVIPATADKDGSYDLVVYCSVCGIELSRETIIVEAYGHDPAEPVEENRIEATCTENGSYDYVIYCVCCEEKTELSRETIIIPASGHNYEAVVTPPTQTEQGYTTYTCSVCGDTYIDDYTDPVIGSEIGGTVTSFGQESDIVTITLTPKGETVPAYTTTVSGNSANYTFSGVVSGEYIMTVSKKNHVTRTYDVIVNEENVTSDVKIHLVGDINGDGKVNTLDVARTNAHAKGMTMLSGYEFSCADINTDNRVNTLDVAKMNAHAKGTLSLW